MSDMTSSTSRPGLAPMLSVRGGSKAVAFYQRAFGATELFRHGDPDDPAGAIVARLSIAGADFRCAEFWVADESPEHSNFSPESLGGSTARMVLTVEDPDGVFGQAIAAGAKEVTPVADRYGWRLGRVVDPFGHHWEIGKPLQPQK
jgi:PhnB protein